MRDYVVAGLAAGLMLSGALIAAAPPASAGCIPFGRGQMCDGPVQPDGRWQRCEVMTYLDGSRTSGCFPMGAGHAPPPLSFQPTLDHIDP
jgi:hypothetical protein